MITLSINQFIKNIWNNLIAIILVSVQFVLTIAVSNLFMEEYEKYSVFEPLEGKKGVYLQFSGISEVEKEELEVVLSEEAEIVCPNQNFYDASININGKNMWAFIYGNDQLHYLPDIYDGEKYYEAEAPEGYIPVNISDNCEGIQVGDIIEVSAYEDADDFDGKAVRLYVAGRFDYWESVLGNIGNISADDCSYSTLFNTPFKTGDEETDNSLLEYDIKIIGDYSQLDKAGINIDRSDRFFLLYPDGTDTSAIDGDVEVMDTFFQNEDASTGLENRVSLEEFFEASKLDLFRKFGRYIPMLFTALVVSVSCFVGMAFVNGQKNKKNNLVMRMLGYKKKNLIAIGFYESIIIIFCSAFISFGVKNFLLYKELAAYSNLHLGFAQIIACSIIVLFVICIYSLIPLTGLRNSSIAEAIGEQDMDN